MTQEHSTTTLLARIAELEAELEAAHTDTAYGCLTRKGLERRYATRSAQSAIIFLDLDNMHDANEKYGYAECDARIRASLAVVRNGDNVAGRWYSGDEIVLTVPATAAFKVAVRLQATFQQNGLSATFGITPAGDDLVTSVAVASDMVQRSKTDGIRGGILTEKEALVTELDTPAIGRKIKYLMHHDRATLIAILRGTRRELWPALADAYIQALGATDATDRQASVPGVLYIWTQLVKEAEQP